jgi:hypothetical protein
MELRPGSRWKSAVCDTEVVVVRSTGAAISLECGGQCMVPHAEPPRPAGAVPAEDRAGGTQAGKRFADEASGVELLCTKGGAGSLSIDGRAIGVKEAKKLPASD